MSRPGCALVVILVGSVMYAADPSPFVLPSVEDKYASAASTADAVVAKAEAEAAKLRKAAAEIRLKAYRDRLAEVTKSGDFDKALAVKTRVEELEKESEGVATKQPKRPRPKETVRFQGHTYALIKENVTWHVAKQRCEEMGGHLVCITSVKEDAFISSLCGNLLTSIGASDEASEGDWINVDGSMPVLSSPLLDNHGGLEHWLMWDGSRFVDWHAGGRSSYVCEWDR
ncbi:MAG: hypothetical protein JSS49_29690 [Planctomycetes bacterium]|nr:hypothetical protein [Planctomycetota bacterium]